MKPRLTRYVTKWKPRQPRAGKSALVTRDRYGDPIDDRGRFPAGRWLEYRATILAGRKNECVNCGSKQRLELDHIVPIKAGGGNNSGNLQILCHDCHRQKTNAEMRKWRALGIV